MPGFGFSLRGRGVLNEPRNLPYFGRERFRHFLFVLFALVLLFPYRIEYKWAYFSTLSVLEIFLAPLFILSAIYWIRSGRIYILNIKIFFVLLLPLVLAIVSCIWSVNISSTVKSIVVYGTSMAAFLITLTLSLRYSFQGVALLFLTLPVFLVLTAYIAYFPGSPISPEAILPAAALEQDSFLLSYQARLSHPFLGLSNSFATILAMLLPFALLVRRSGLWRRISWWVAVITFAAIVATGSRGVLVAIVMAYGGPFLLSTLKSTRIPRGGITFVAMALSIGGLFLFLSPESQRHLADRLSFVNVMIRFDAFFTVFDILRTVPWGIGSGVGLSEVSALSLGAVHNAYLQNLLWFGWIGGGLMNMALLALPFFVRKIPVRTHLGQEARRAVALSVVILLLVNLSQASWEGSVLRVWIYFLIGLGLVSIRQADRYELEPRRG